MDTKKFKDMADDEKRKFFKNIFILILFVMTINSFCIIYALITIDELQKNTDRELIKIEKELGMINNTHKLIVVSNYDNPLDNWKNKSYKEKYLK